MTARRVGRLLLCLATLGPAALAQDTNYWHIAYGPVGQLVGGQVIASSRDLSATFYNPGALSLDQTGAFLLSTETFQWENVSTQSPLDRELLDLSSNRFGSAPSLIAGTLPRWFGDDTRLAWSFLTRQELKSRLGQRSQDFLARAESSVAETYKDVEVNEQWGGLTLSRPLGEHWGLGGTLYGVYRGQRIRNELTAQALTTGEGGAFSLLGITDYDYYHWRLLGKLGLAYQGERLRLGLSVTTPSLGAFGSGQAGYTVSLIGVDRDGDARPDSPLLESASAESLDTDYRSSWAVGGGASWRTGTTWVHANVEWFAPVGRFTVMALPVPGAESVLLEQELNGVLNAGVGVEHEFRNGISAYGAFRTDFAAALDVPASASVSNWDLYHLSAGGAFRVASTQLTLGATYSKGSQTNPLASPVPPELAPSLGLDGALDTSYQRVVVLLGFLFGN